MMSNQITIAVVEDNLALGEAICDMLTQEGYHPVLCTGVGELSELSSQSRIDLVLLDLQLPDGNGLSTINRNQQGNAPTIIISGKGDEIDRIIGLEMGADDYMVKPFSLRELAARVRALLRRSDARLPAASASTKPLKGFRFSGWTLDTDRRKLFNPSGGNVVLTVAEYDLLLAMVSAGGRVLSRNRLLELTRSENDDVFDRTIDVLILRLRRKIEDNCRQPRFLRTERGVGYVFGSEIERLGE
jgi:two-component system OmpR family response regulator